MSGLLTLVQWLSPAFPTGGYAFSHGMEQVIADGVIRSGDDLALWLGAILRHGAGRQDAILLAEALREGADHVALAGYAVALAASAERLSETSAQGAALARAVSAVTGREIGAGPLPVVLGQAAAGLGVAPVQVIGLYLHAFASNLVSAAVRFVPLGQNEGQRVLAGLHGLIEDLAAEAAGLGLDDIATAAFGADLAAMRHETMDVRIFKT
ncbi:urease accessory protein UreF [Paragemmobacter straminiformis]|uniref:Urease accessory protein UreF n=1 Tax=Paragemmobacter straminiformis TaxID=2045119 RepID=A0A842IB68_9RHOB|nr:urease accessory UreF family protein [Gemmobacter straminiformis]MBC2836597.1 urease accessory protein UreF [Gemmobacter straminiformis]